MNFITTNIAAADTEFVCTISECKEIDVVVPEFAAAQNFTATQVWKLAGEVLSVSGLAPNFQVVESTDIANAAALMRGSDRFIVFNPDWLAQVANSSSSKWEVTAILAHEIGHHLQGHTLLGIGSRPAVELQADEYAGFALGALGASKEQAEALWQGFSEEGSPTHPPRVQRLAAVERGWTRATALFGDRAAPAAVQPDPRPIPRPTRRLDRDRSADASCVPVQTALGQAVSCVSSLLVDRQGVQHAPAHLFDDDPQTAWIEDAFQFGAGQTIAVDFTVPTDIRRILFQNSAGDVAGQSTRIKQVNVRSSGGFDGVITLQDQADWQFVPLALGAVEWISFTIVDVYPGTGAQDTGLAGLGFE